MRGRRENAGAVVLAAALLVITPGAATAQADRGERCEVLDPSVCLQPFPSDAYTRAADTPTGRRLDFDTTAMPRNIVGVPIAAADYNRFDGFSPGSSLITHVPGLDNPRALRETNPVPIERIGAFDRPRAPVVVIDARSGKRHPIWVELDSNTTSPAETNLIIRPAVNFAEGHRYLVALRDLRGADGKLLTPGPAFRALRDGRPTARPEIERRRRAMERIFGELDRFGIGRGDLHLAWDFTVASRRSLSERALSIRDDAFAQLGDRNLADRRVAGRSPRFEVTQIENFPPGPDTLIARRVSGSVLVPCYLDLNGCPPGSRFRLGSTGLPVRTANSFTRANFVCNIPRAAFTAGAGSARPSLYGHGLLGSADEVSATNVKQMSGEHNFIFCATDWIGFSTSDVPNVGLILQDLSRFPTLVDRTQQGFLNFMYLGRALIHRDGLGSHPAFQTDGKSLIDRRELYYDGNSQGGILGGSLAALAPDFRNAVLGVPGMNYSTLLQRSSDFPPYAEGRFLGLLDDSLGEIDLPVGGLYDAYPNRLERPLIFALMQTYWDRGEANGYAHHMTGDPLPNTPGHRVLMHPAVGDHQVANVTAEVEARTIGARIRRPAIARERRIGRDQLFGIAPIKRLPYAGSAIVYWDTGAGNTPPPPLGNTSPTAGRDPHGAPRNTVAARRQKSAFLSPRGRVRDFCASGPCRADDYEP